MRLLIKIVSRIGLKLRRKEPLVWKILTFRFRDSMQPTIKVVQAMSIYMIKFNSNQGIAQVKKWGHRRAWIEQIILGLRQWDHPQASSSEVSHCSALRLWRATQAVRAALAFSTNDISQAKWFHRWELEKLLLPKFKHWHLLARIMAELWGQRRD